MNSGFSREALLIALGVMGMLVSAFADSIGLGHPGFGLAQVSGVVIGALVALAATVKILFPDTRILVRLLAGIYMSGILYTGLRPHYCESTQYNVKVLLEVNSFDWYDLAINTMGFVPLGYLLMLSLGNWQKEQRPNLLYGTIMVAGIGSFVSLFLEMSQYYLISGRASSLVDWASNTLGTLLGITVYLVLSREPGYVATK
ncbi:MAG: VanZ family protein [Candidatus Hodarchaeota archaeon]